MFTVGFFSLLLAISSTYAEHIISSPIVTSWGDWGAWDYCPANQFAIGFQLKTEGWQRRGDDTALNGIQLMCGTPGNRNTNKYIKSSIGGWGGWGGLKYCDGLMTGFQLRSEVHQRRGDDTAANNMNGFCTKADGLVTSLAGDGMDWGSWTAEQHCNKGYAVCGIRTQVESHQRKGDDTALNNVEMKCCNFIDALTSCTPSDRWVEISTCDNRGSSSSMRCSYSETIGISKTSGSSISQSNTQQITQTFGIEFSQVSAQLSEKFKNEIATSESTTHVWSSETSQTWSRVTAHNVNYEVPGNSGSKLMQVIGTCGIFEVHTSHFKKVDL